MPGPSRRSLARFPSPGPLPWSQWGGNLKAQPSESLSLLLFSDWIESRADAGLIDGVLGAAVVTLAAELPVGCRRSGALFPGTRRGFGLLLSFTGKAWFGHCDTGATSPFGATLAAISLVAMSVSFPGPCIFEHAATGTGRTSSGIEFFSDGLVHLALTITYGLAPPHRANPPPSQAKSAP